MKLNEFIIEDLVSNLLLERPWITLMKGDMSEPPVDKTNDHWDAEVEVYADYGKKGLMYFIQILNNIIEGVPYKDKYGSIVKLETDEDRKFFYDKITNTAIKKSSDAVYIKNLMKKYDISNFRDYIINPYEQIVNDKTGNKIRETPTPDQVKYYSDFKQ